MAGIHQVALATNSNLTTAVYLCTCLNAVGKEMGDNARTGVRSYKNSSSSDLNW